VSAIDTLSTDWTALSEVLAASFEPPPPGLLPAPGLTACRIEPRGIDATWESIETIRPLAERWSGWLRRESWVGRTCPESGKTDPGREAAGAPLDGEWVSPDGATSARLLHLGGSWRLIEIEEGVDEPVLREETTLVAAGGGPALRYAVYWGLRTTAGVIAPAVVRRATRFLGFGSADA